VSLSSGTRLGPYEVLGPLGAGGMGEVYRAKDTRLARTVAIKVLPEHLAYDQDLRQRFEREARAVSSLNHPHICVLHDIGNQDGTDYLVLEYLEGESLHDRLEKGPLPLDQVVRYAIEIADALDKAHRHGVIHRDVKPGNVMLTKGGAKLLDFGLARVAKPIVSGDVDVSDLATPPTPLTGAGTLLGTVPFMAPEQIEGREADARTDIWALGALIYEMVTGRRAFVGNSPASLVGAILKDQPPRMRELQPLTPHSLERLVKTCPDKDPDERWQNAHDVAAELRWIGERQEEIALGARRGPRALGLALAGGLGALLAAGVLGFLLVRRAAATAERLHVAEAVRFTYEPGLFESPTWSPDGKLVAFASNRSGNFEIYVRRVDGGQEINVTDHPAEDIQPAFSPDGRSIAFISTRSARTGLVPVGQALGLEYRVFGGDLWITPALGGTARRLAPDANYPTWRPDGGAILYVSGPEDRRILREISPDGSSSREVLKSEDSRWEILRPSYSHDGLWITFGDTATNLLLMPARGGTPRALFTSTSHAWADDGSLYFLKRGAAGGTTIGRVGMDSKTGLVTGSEEVVAVLTGALGDIAVAPGSHGLAVSAIEAGFNLARLPLSPDGSRPTGPEDALSSGSIRNRYPAYSFDGRRLAYSSNRTGRLEVWVLDLETLRQERLPTPEGLETYISSWFPDGQSLLVMGSTIGGPRTLWVISLDGSRAEELRWAGEAPPTLGSLRVSPDGRRVLVELVEGPEGHQLYEFDLVGRSKRRVASAPGNTYDGIWSRDGRQIAYIANTAGTLQLWTQPAQGGEPRQLPFGRERMRHPSFSPDGRWIYVQASHRNIWRVPTAGGSLEEVTHFPESGLFLEEPTLSPDGRTLAYARWNGGSSLWLLQLGHDQGALKEGHP
jgi:eukaryotic-like serine/threonine-protein kinase